MTETVMLGILVGLPAFFVLLLRTNAAVVFLALCTGSVLSKYLGEDAINILHSFLPSTNQVADSALKIVLLLLPAALTAVFMRRNASGGKALFNVVPAVVTGALTALLIVPVLPLSVQSNLTGSNSWILLEQFQGFIVGAGVLASLLLLWGSHKKPRRGKHHK